MPRQGRRARRVDGTDPRRDVTVTFHLKKNNPQFEDQGPMSKFNVTTKMSLKW